MDDLNVLDGVADSQEMMEVIKLSKQYKLDSLFKACETHFKELMVQSFDCSNLIALKMNGAQNPQKQHQRKGLKPEEQKDPTRTSGRAVQQVSQSSAQGQKKPKKLQHKLNNML